MPGKYRFYLSAAWLTLILAAAIQRVGRAFPAPGAELNSDARWVYLPNARKLLETPWAFLTTDPASYHVAPLGYAWAAAWGADPVRTQLANSVLFLASVVLLWRCATRLGGLWAGLVATSLMVFNPELHSHIPQVLTESIFLFGLMLCLAGGVEYVLGDCAAEAGKKWPDAAHVQPTSLLPGSLLDRRRGLWLALAALGLTITLLSRPVLQLLALGALLLAVAATAGLEYRQRHTPGRDPRWHRVVNRKLCLALAAALLLPAATVLKNGMFFGVWGMGTGAGTGLYYGVSPLKMGLEPVYSHFHYDAGAAAAAAAPETRGNPLDQRADQVNARVALDIVRNTSLPDNLAFFTHKLRAWLLYSTPELQVSYKLRTIRLFEWLSIATALIVLASRWRRGAASLLPGTPGKTPEKLGILLVLLLLALAMAVQLTPVLYNTRYNTYFMEPWLMLLCGASVGILLHDPAPQASTPVGTRWARLSQWGRWALVGLLVALAFALARHAQRHETWGMDPYRPGPTETLLDTSAMGALHSWQATPVRPGQWRLDASPATLWLPLRPDDAALLHPDRSMDALWRMRFAVAGPSGAPRACRQALVQVTPAYPSSQPWFIPKPVLHLQLDGAPHTYALHGNDTLRPTGAGEMGITFSCPPGTLVTWEGAELLRSTLPEAARALVQQGIPINPYRHSEPSASTQ